MSKDKKCTFRINGEVYSTGVGEKDCAAKRKAWNKVREERKVQMKKALGMTTQDTTKTTDTKPKKKSKLQQIIKAKLEKRKKNKAQKRMLDSIRGQKRRGFDGKWN